MRTPAILVFLALVGGALAGCIEAPDAEPAPQALDPVEDVLVTVHDALGNVLRDGNGTAVPGATLHEVGAEGPEPSLGVTSNGDIFFVALEDVLRSSDHGETWEVVSDVLSSPATLDPMLWVDPVTDRVFSNQLYVGCSYLSWSDDQGASWTSNPVACGLPVNDHQKVTTGPFVEGSPLAVAATYENVVYYAYNQIAGGRVAVSLDGGVTFPISSATFRTECPDGLGGLHGAITAGPDGAVYVPARNCGGPIVARSMDNGVTWTQTTVHDDVGTSDHDKNPEVAVDRDNNLYLVWPGADNRLHLATSMDHGDSWSAAHLAAPPQVQTTTMPVIQAGDAGRIAIAYYGTEDSDDAPDLVPEDALWHLYLTYSLNALDETPVFTTVRLTPANDPIQVGPISTNTGDAPDGSRNLLDFIDMVLDADGRPYVAFADGCTAGCKLDDMTTSRDAQGVVAIVQDGPSLYADVGALMPLGGRGA